MESEFLSYEKKLGYKELKTDTYYNEATKTQVTKFDSVHEVINIVTENLINKTWQWACDAEKPENNITWTFGKDYDSLQKTHEALLTGTVRESYLDRVERTKLRLFEKYPELNNLERSATLKRRKKRYNDMDGEICIDRYASNDLNCFIKKQKVGEKKAVRLFLNASLSASNDSEQFLKNIITFAAVSDIFNRAGIATEIILGKVTHFKSSDTNYGIYATTVKRANEVLDIAKLLSSGLSGFYRYYMFYVTCNTIKGFKGYDKSTLGYPIHDLQQKEIKQAIDFLNIDIAVNGDSLSDSATIVFGEVEKILERK